MMLLDQSFSVANFRKIFDYENRKGNYLESSFFSDVKIISGEIKSINDEIRKNKKEIYKSHSNKKEAHEKYIEFFKSRKRELADTKTKKEKKLNELLEKVSKNVNNKNYEFKIKKGNIINAKQVYTVEKSPENFFILKQLQYNVNRSFKVKQSDRFSIVNQVKSILDDDLPKLIIRTDIKEFYETIPHNKLLEIINNNNLLTFFSKKIICKILKDYNVFTSTKNKAGIPRGIGISAYLAELYMRDIDNEIRSLKDVIFYTRYVDDIIIVFTLSNNNQARDYIKEVTNIIQDKWRLQINENKTMQFQLRKNGNATFDFDYLGYKFSFDKVDKRIKINLSQSKYNKILNKITIALNQYNIQKNKFPKQARRLLVHRIRYLTGNTKLVGNKKNILVGIYFSNSLLTSEDDLVRLDKELSKKVEAEITCPKLKQRIIKFRFQIGFNEKRFKNYKLKKLEEILSIWRSKKEIENNETKNCANKI